MGKTEKTRHKAYVRQCGACGATFQTTRNTKHYCDGKCRALASRMRTRQLNLAAVERLRQLADELSQMRMRTR